MEQPTKQYLYSFLQQKLTVEQLYWELTFGLPKGVVLPTPLRFFSMEHFCFWNIILTFYVAVGGPFAHI